MMQSSLEEVPSGLRAKLAQALTRPGELVVLSTPAPLCPADVVLAALPGDDGFVWDPPRGPVMCGVASARTLHARGRNRFEQIRTAARELWSEVQHHNFGASRPPLCLVGGFAFDAGQAEHSPWTAFGDARFVLPRLGYVRLEQEAWLSLALPKSELATTAAQDTALAELSRAGRELAAQADRTHGSEPRRRELVPSLPDPGAWDRGVAAIKAGIHSGEFQKIVLAHRALVHLPDALDLAALLSRLEASSPECTRFVLRHGGTSFVGATPERLISKRGLELGTEAVAGSIKPGGESRRRELLGSAKDLHEHELVVGEILRVLEPVSRHVWHASGPEVRELKHVAHLCTPIRAELAKDMHVLELVQRLHPTSAVGGLPRQRALDWLSQHEQEPRGWYAGPVGLVRRSG